MSLILKKLPEISIVPLRLLDGHCFGAVKRYTCLTKNIKWPLGCLDASVLSVRLKAAMI